MAVKYELLYFQGHGMARVCRILLDMSGEQWNDCYPKDWDKEKKDQPFMRVPVLTEFQADGSKFVLAENNAICRYLARPLGLTGSNAKETAVIDQFCESWNEIHQKYWPLFYYYKNFLSEEQFNKLMSDLREQTIIPILTRHEEALAKNGTGFYVGDKMSLADILAAVSLPLFDYNNELTKETHPRLFALREKLSTLDAFKAHEARFPGNTR